MPKCLAVLIVCSLFIFSCTAQQVAKDVTAAKNEASKINKDSLVIVDESNQGIALMDETKKLLEGPQLDLPTVLNNLDRSKELFGSIGIKGQGIVKSSEVISKLADHIHGILPNLEEKDPLWLKTVYIGLIALVFAGIIYLGIRLGLFAIIGNIINSIAASMPGAREKRMAEVLQKAEDDNDPMTVKEATAAIRGISPTVDNEFKKKKGDKDAPAV